MMRHLLAAALALALAPAAASADPAATRLVDLKEWRQDALYGSGWRAQRLLGGEVFGPDAAEIGTVDDIVVSAEGRITDLVVRLGGVLSVGGELLTVPWNATRVSPRFDRVTIPGDPPPPAGGERAWKVSDLIDDYVTLGGKVGYGYVDDLLFDRAGRLQAMIVSREGDFVTDPPRALPFHGYGQGFQPALDYTDLPYGEDEVAGLPPFDIERLE